MCISAIPLLTHCSLDMPLLICKLKHDGLFCQPKSTIENKQLCLSADGSNVNKSYNGYRSKGSTGIWDCRIKATMDTEVNEARSSGILE